MGGFAGGDEGGYWDDEVLPNAFDKIKKKKTSKKNGLEIEIRDSIYTIKSYAKVNILTNILEDKEGHFNLESRCTRVGNLYDTIHFVPSKCKTFTIEGCEGIDREANSIYRAYKALSTSVAGLDVVEFFDEHKVVVKKYIPLSSGLGACASNAAAFMHLVKEVCNLILTKEELTKIAQSIGEDISFFLNNYISANTLASGAVVEVSDEQILDFDILTTDIKCDRNSILNAQGSLLSSLCDWKEKSSKSILESTTQANFFDTLYTELLGKYPDLKKDYKEGYFFSGHVFFKLID